jgi:hypothetical protein
VTGHSRDIEPEEVKEAHLYEACEVGSTAQGGQIWSINSTYLSRTSFFPDRYVVPYQVSS